MSAASDKFENDVAKTINKVPGIKAERPKVSTAYPDVKVEYKNFKDTNAVWVEVKMNGGPHSVLLADANGHAHAYTEVPGDYTKIQVMTAGASIAVYAIG